LAARSEWIAHRDFTLITALEDDALRTLARQRRAPARHFLSAEWACHLHSLAQPGPKSASGTLETCGLREIRSAFKVKPTSARQKLRSESGRVEVWRGGCRSNISVAAPFVWRCLTGSAMTLFPHPAHRTGHADLPHPALGQDLTPSPKTRRAQAGSGVRARSARRGARVDRPRPCVA